MIRLTRTFSSFHSIFNKRKTKNRKNEKKKERKGTDITDSIVAEKKKAQWNIEENTMTREQERERERVLKCTKNNSINTVHQFSTFLQLLTCFCCLCLTAHFSRLFRSILVLIPISFTVRNRAAGISSGSNAEIIIRIGFKCLFWLCPLRTSRSIIDFNFIFMARYESLPSLFSLSLSVDIFFTLLFILFYFLFIFFPLVELKWNTLL